MRHAANLTSPDSAIEPSRRGGFDQSVNRFRRKRGARLQAMILDAARRLGRDLDILDVGGRPDYWANVGTKGIARIRFLNLDETEFREHEASIAGVETETLIGDGRDLRDFPDASVDMVHSNSVIEHVGTWDSMAAMAREAMRVGRNGWVQTPAWVFPVEPHFHAPFVHWVGRPLGVRLMGLSALDWCRNADLSVRREQLDRINLLSRRELEALFPGRPIYTEWLLFPKSYVVHWS